MKACPFCAEEIQDAAIRCKHCGGDISSVEAAIREEADDKDENKSAGLIFGLVGAAAFLYGAYYYWSHAQTYTALTAVGGAIVFFLIAKFAWVAGKEFGKAYKPNIIIAGDNQALIQQQMLWENAPVIGTVIGFLIVAMSIVCLSVFVFEENPMVSGVPDTMKISQPAPNLPKISIEEKNALPVEDKSISALTDAKPITSNASLEILNTATAHNVVASPNLIPAGFDCTKASTSSEKLICSDAVLSDADGRLTSAYRAALSTSPDTDALKTEQNAWRKTERDTCFDAACMFGAYNKRISQLTQ